jgi:hypothetical protein
MTAEDAEKIITDIWKESAMEEHSGTDKVREILEAALLAAFNAGREFERTRSS